MREDMGIFDLVTPDRTAILTVVRPPSAYAGDLSLLYLYNGSETLTLRFSSVKILRTLTTAIETMLADIEDPRRSELNAYHPGPIPRAYSCV